ncbi:Suf domain-containing protein [Aphelenchoides besseyi]|nr:Suf domain-containing protein [Aphelenchoides besseyi]KAI6194378.1 Suf domain-containing protein [Aphelenchoides besseyi]
MATGSVLSPERRIELNPFDTDAWNLLIRENKLFGQCLTNVLNIDLWKYYLFYLKETKGHLPTFREKMAQAYSFALDKVGLDMNAQSIYVDYVTFLKSVPAVGQYAENQRISAIRKVYQRGVLVPMLQVENLWNDYCVFERGINPQLAEKLITDRNRDHQTARRIARLLEQHTRGINRNLVSIPPRGTQAELKQVELWRKYIHWEKSNPLNIDEYIVYAYDQALLCLGYLPDIWYEAALFQQQAAKLLTERGDVKQAGVVSDEIVALYEKAITGLMRDSQIIYFAYADYEEERRNFDKAKSIYNRLLERETVNPTLPYVQLMKFIRRTEGVKAARLIFKRAREDSKSDYHIYVAAALMEFFNSKDTEVAIRIFDLGLKKFGGDPDYTLTYTDFLTHLNDNNTRVVFERILTADQLTPDKTIDIWDQYLEFESQVGDLASVLKVDDRRREALKEQFEDRQALLLVDRYRFLNLAPCTSDQLKYMGYSKQIRHGFSVVNGVQSTSSMHANANSTVTKVNGQTIEIGGFPMPDTDQMLPFKPTPMQIVTSHPVPGGRFPAPPAVALLIQQLPPPWTFNGPFVDINALMDSLANFTKELPKSDSRELLDPNAVFGGVKAADIKKEMYQLLTTTTDPSVIMSGNESSDFIPEQDRFLPIANVAKIMRRVVPENGKLSKESKECVQECVTEFIQFVVAEASERCTTEKRKTITCEDLLQALATLNFDPYVDVLKVYIERYRKAAKNLQTEESATTTSTDKPQSSTAQSTSNVGEMQSVPLQPSEIFVNPTTGQHYLKVNGNYEPVTFIAQPQP